jgi:hypothetical protein
MVDPHYSQLYAGFFFFFAAAAAAAWLSKFFGN